MPSLEPISFFVLTSSLEVLIGQEKQFSLLAQLTIHVLTWQLSPWHLERRKWSKFTQGWVANGVECLLVLPHVSFRPHHIKHRLRGLPTTDNFKPVKQNSSGVCQTPQKVAYHIGPRVICCASLRQPIKVDWSSQGSCHTPLESSGSPESNHAWI